MGGNAQYKAQATDAGLKDADAAEQQPEAPTPLDKTAGEDTERRAPDLTGFWVQTPITEPEVVVRLFIGTQNRLVAFHSALIKAHEEADISPRSVIYRPVGSTMQLVTKLSSPNFAVLQGHRYLSPRSSAYRDVACRASTS
jgi:hypothetical protein